MARLALVTFGALCCAPAAFSADPQTPPVERQLRAQAAMATARKHLDARTPGEAVAVLEANLATADGNPAFLDLLRAAYAAEQTRLEADPAAPPERLAQLRLKLTLLGGSAPKDPPAAVVPPVPRGPAPPPDFAAPPAAPAAPPAPTAVAPLTPLTPPAGVQPELPTTPVVPPGVAEAVVEFKRGNYAAADRLFAAAGARKLSADHKTAWAYCRIKLAADRVNAPDCDAATAAAAAREVGDALALVTDNDKLAGLGRDVLKAARAKAGAAKAGAPAAVGREAGDALDTPSFRVQCAANRDLGDAVAKAAEAARKQIFERWSGPVGAAWQPKCEIVIHPSAAAYARATGKPAALTGHATVRLTDGRATERRIDLRADDDGLVANTLPRELTHVVMADLCADPPPKWALEGMAILAASPEEVGRYTRTLARCARDGEVRPLAALFELKDYPTDKLTGFYCQSASVTEYLVRLKGDKNFKIFLGDAHRYGVAAALKRQYGINGVADLDQAWKRASLDQARGQSP
jgi:hypothetical protein